MTDRRAGKQRRTAGAFTLIEATFSLAIIAVAGAAVLLGVDCSLQTTTECLERTVAAGMARQLLEEVVGSRYCDYAESGGSADPAHDPVLQPSGWEAATGTRERFDDIGDYNGVRSQPPVDTWGTPLGRDDPAGRRHPAFYANTALFDQWRQEIDVYYVSETDLVARLPKGQVSDYRAVEVRIVRVDGGGRQRVLATARQVVAYVPPLP